MKALGKRNDLAGQIKIADLATFPVNKINNIVPKKVTLLYDKSDSFKAKAFIEKFDENKVIYAKNIEQNGSFEEEMLGTYDYIVFFISEKSVKNDKLMRVLLNIYKRNNFIAIIIDPIIFEFKERVKIYKYWEGRLNYADELLKSSMINKDVCQEYLICKDIVQMLGELLYKAYEDNIMKDMVEDVFADRLSQDGINNVKKSHEI